MATVIENFTSSGTFTCPSEVTEVTVECWGIGGRGGYQGSTSSRAAGGGGGGGYTKGVVNVTPLQNYTVTVGTEGSTWPFTTTDTVFTGDDSKSVIGRRGASIGTGATGGAGGAAETVTGHITASYKGGNGGTCNTQPNRGGGGGGGGAGTTAAGSNGLVNSGDTGGAGGAGGSQEGGTGGAGGNNNASGNNGVALAGGGGGAGANANQGTSGSGIGARGHVRITYITGGEEVNTSRFFQFF